MVNNNNFRQHNNTYCTDSKHFHTKHQKIFSYTATPKNIGVVNTVNLVICEL